MPQYQVATIKRPRNWGPETPDDVPLEFAGPVSILSETDDLFEAVSQVVAHNESDQARQQNRWAVVVDPSGNGRLWPAGRVCTPITYKITAIWWPDGWEPNSPLDVPNCVWQAQGPGGDESISYSEAEATVLGLNRQCMDHPGATWHVVVAIENEAVSRTICHDSAGTETTVETRRMHVIQPEQGSHGNCSYCPAHEFPCAKAEWSSQIQTVSAHCSRVPSPTVES